MDEIKELRADVKTLLEAVAELKTLTETAAERCPYRELIAKSANNARRLGLLEKVVYGGTLLTIFVSVLLKALGWI